MPYDLMNTCAELTVTAAVEDMVDDMHCSIEEARDKILESFVVCPDGRIKIIRQEHDFLFHCPAHLSLPIF